MNLRGTEPDFEFQPITAMKQINWLKLLAHCNHLAKSIPQTAVVRMGRFQNLMQTKYIRFPTRSCVPGPEALEKQSLLSFNECVRLKVRSS